MSKESKTENKKEKQLSRRDFLKASGAVIASAVLFSSLAACTSKITTATSPITSSSSPSTPTSSASAIITTSSTVVSPSSTSAMQTLKIGLEAFLGSNVSLDWIHAVEVMTDHDNKNGGLDIGGTKYKVELVEYDSNSNQNTEVAAINKLVYEDKVKFILCEGSFAAAWLSTTDKERVVVFSAAPPAQTNLIPKYHYSFNGSFLNPMTTVVTAWYFNQHPEARNSFVNAFPDDMFGHMVSGFVASVNKPFNITSTDVFFPANSQDLSAIGTKVKTMNPMVFGCVTESDAQTGAAYNAVRQAGYTGQFLNANIVSMNALTQIMSPEAIEGFICAAIPSEFDPPLTQAAKDFENLWVAKYGKWDSPTITFCSPYSALKAALAQAGTIDTDKVAAVLGNGLKFESPISAGMMISRPDLGTDSTVDSIATYYIKQIKNNKPTLIATIPIDDALEIFKTAYPPASTGAAGGPPPGAGGPPS